ncbi:MAG: amidohydrolase family protein [Pseudoclavibacter sp.]
MNRKDHRFTDVHSHFLPPWYVDVAIAAGHAHPDGIASWPAWSPQKHLAVMDAHGIEQSVLSLSSPGVFFGDGPASVDLCRRVNDYAADLVGRWPDRFAFFASVPLPLVDEANEELSRALDDLGASGVVVPTNVGGQYLSDDSFDQFMNELHRRRSVMFMHPTSPVGWEHTSLGYPTPMVEFFADTTRVVSAMLMKGLLSKYSGIRPIVPHCGASLPLLVERLRLFAAVFPAPAGAPPLEEGLERLWFDLAGTPMPLHADALIDVVGTDRILYGSDYCWTPEQAVAAQLESLDSDWKTDEHGPWRELVSKNTTRLWAGQFSEEESRTRSRGDKHRPVRHRIRRLLGDRPR